MLYKWNHVVYSFELAFLTQHNFLEFHPNYCVSKNSFLLFLAVISIPWLDLPPFLLPFQNDFFMLILYPENLINSLLSSSSFKKNRFKKALGIQMTSSFWKSEKLWGKPLMNQAEWYPWAQSENHSTSSELLRAISLCLSSCPTWKGMGGSS